MGGPPLTYKFIPPWTLGLPACFSSCGQCRHEHRRVNLSLRSCFLSYGKLNVPSALGKSCYGSKGEGEIRISSQVLISGHHRPDTKTKDICKENYRSASLMNINAETLSKMLENSIHWHVKRVTHQDQVGFIAGMQRFFCICHISVIHHMNKLKNTNRVIISTEREKAFDKSQHPFLIEFSREWT